MATLYSFVLNNRREPAFEEIYKLFAYKFVFGLVPAVTRLVRDLIVTNSSAAEG